MTYNATPTLAFNSVGTAPRLPQSEAIPTQCFFVEVRVTLGSLRLR